MMKRIFDFAFPLFLLVMALVVGAACYQTTSIVPTWQQDISLLKNYRGWGVPCFPVLSPLMAGLWLVTVITGFNIKMPNKAILYAAHVAFLLVLVSTFAYFAPILLTYMGDSRNSISNEELTTKLNDWAGWDLIRQLVGLLLFAVYIFMYGRINLVLAKKTS